VNLLGFEYPQNVFWVFSILFYVLCLATLFVTSTGQYFQDRSTRELWDRTRTWWWIVLVLALALGSPERGVYWFFGFVSFLAFKEFISILPTREHDGPLIIVGMFLIAAQYYLAAHHEHHGLFMISGFVYGVPIVTAIMVMLQGRTTGFMNQFGSAIAVYLIAIYAPSHLAHFFSLPAGGNETGAAGLVLFIVLITQLNDVAQYIFGKLFGKHQIAPAVSPKKTWEGFAGGTLSTALIAALLAPYLTPFSTLEAVVAGLAAAPLGFLGDIFISAIKRDVGVKDTSSLLPGHGGVLDRIDSLILVAPIYFHVVYYYVYMKGGLVCSPTA
jgi:phosphatidate cytidylyltransferase